MAKKKETIWASIITAAATIIAAIIGGIALYLQNKPPSSTTDLERNKATETAVATNSNPYQPPGTLALIDPLSSAKAWQEDTNANFGGLCRFTDGKYQIQQAPTGKEFSCREKITYSNFAFEVKMTIIQGDCGGLVIRNSYTFVVCQNGDFFFDKYEPGKGGRILSKNTSTVKQGMNIIAVVANGYNLDLYVNRQRIASINDTTYDRGVLGLSAVADKNFTIVTYQDARVWII